MVELRGPAPVPAGLSAATTQYVDSAVATRAPLASPAFTGVPTAPTAGTGDSSTTIATTAFVATAVAGVSSQAHPAQSANGTVTYQRIATLDGVGPSSGAHLSMLVAGVGDFGVPLKGQGILEVGQRGTNPSGISARLTYLGGLPNVGTFYTVSTGSYTLEVWWSGGTYQYAPTFTVLDSAFATLKFDSSTATAPANLVTIPQTQTAPLDSPVFTGTPTAPTQGESNNSTTLATTAYMDGGRLGVVNADKSNGDWNGNYNSGLYRGSNMANNPGDGGWTWVLNMAHDQGNAWRSQLHFGYTGSAANRAFFRYQSNGSWQGYREFAFTNSPAFTGTPTAPTPAGGDNSTTLATTAYVNGNYIRSTSGNGYVDNISVNNLNNGTQGWINSTNIRDRTDSVASAVPGTGSTTRFVTMNSNGTFSTLNGSPRFPTAYSDVITTRGLFVGSTGQLGTSASTIKKKNVHGEIAMDDAMLEKWTGLRTVLFDYKFDEEHRDQTGMIAEDVEALGDGFDHLLYYNEQEGSEGFGELDGLAYEKMPVWNRMAIAALLRRIKALEERIPA